MDGVKHEPFDDLMWGAVVFCEDAGCRDHHEPPGCSQLAQCELVDDHREEKLLQAGTNISKLAWPFE